MGSTTVTAAGVHAAVFRMTVAAVEMESGVAIMNGSWSPKNFILEACFARLGPGGQGTQVLSPFQPRVGALTGPSAGSRYRSRPHLMALF